MKIYFLLLISMNRVVGAGFNMSDNNSSRGKRETGVGLRKNSIYI